MNPLLLLLLAAGGIAAATSSSKTEEKAPSAPPPTSGSGGRPSADPGVSPCGTATIAYNQAAAVLRGALAASDRGLAEKAVASANFARQALAAAGCPVPPQLTLPGQPAPGPTPGSPKAPSGYSPAKPSGKAPPPPSGWTENYTPGPEAAKPGANAAFCAKKQGELDKAGAEAIKAAKAGDMKTASGWATKATGVLAQMKNAGCTPVIPPGLAPKTQKPGAPPPEKGCDLARSIFQNAIGVAQKRIGEKNLVSAQSAATTAQGALQTASALGCPIDAAPLQAILAMLGGSGPMGSTPSPAGAITNCSDAASFYSNAVKAAQAQLGAKNLVGSQNAIEQVKGIFAQAQKLGCGVDPGPLASLTSALGVLSNLGSLGGSGSGALPAPPPGAVLSSHTIVYGDTPTGLAKKYVKDSARWRELGKANPGLGPLQTVNGTTNYANWRPGFVLTLPPGWGGAPLPALPQAPPGMPGLPAMSGAGATIPGASAGSTTPNSGVAGLPMSFPIRSGDIPSQLAAYYTGSGLRWKELLVLNPSLGSMKADGTLPGWKVGVILTIPGEWNPGLKPLPSKKS